MDVVVTSIKKIRMKIFSHFENDFYPYCRLFLILFFDIHDQRIDDNTRHHLKRQS